MASLLVTRPEPVPTLGGVGRGGLGWISDKTIVLFGAQIHARAGGEVLGGLGAAVQRDDHRQGLAAIAARHVELVGAASDLVAVGPHEELPAFRHVGKVGCRRFCQPAQAESEAGVRNPVEEMAPKRLGQIVARSFCPIPGAGVELLPGAQRRSRIRDLNSFWDQINCRR